MRWILSVVFCTSLWAAGNTCTLADGGSGAACHSSICTLSAIAADTAHANWTGSGCTANGYVPTSDYIVIPDGFNLNANQAWIVGNYGLPNIGYVYGVTGLPTSGYSGSCTATFSGGNAIMGNSATGGCAINGAGAVVVTMYSGWGPGLYYTATAPTVAISGGYAGSGMVQFVGGGGTPAVNLNNTGVLQISAAVTARGSIVYAHGETNTTDAVLGNPGGSLIFDSSGAVDPMGTRYQFTGNTFYYDYRAFHAMGTASQHFTVTSQVGGGNGFFGQITSYCCTFLASYTDFSKIGDSLFTPILIDANVTYDVEHSTFTGMVPLSIPTSATSTVRHDYNVHIAPAGAADISIVGTAALTTGVREVVGNVFAGLFNNNIGASGITMTGNYFGGSWLINSDYAAPWASFSGNFERRVPCGDVGKVSMQGSASNSFFYEDSDCDNNHWAAGFPGSTYDGLVFDTGGDTGYGDANIFMQNSGGSFVMTHLLTPAAASGFSSGAPVLTFLQGGTSDGQWTVDHNSIEANGYSDGAVDTETIEPSAGQLASFRSNLIWGLASVPSGYDPGGDQGGSSLGVKFLDIMGSGAVADVVSPANADYNDGWNLIANCSSWYTFQNQANQYCAKFSSGPDTGGTTVGAHDLSQDARFADSNRSLMLFDYYYLGHQSYPAWQTSHSYSIGDTVVNPIAWFYGGLYVNYRCIAAHTSDTTTEPGSARFYFHSGTWIPSSTRGNNWRAYWEPASLYQIRQGVAAQTKIADGAIGCVACGIIDALRAWVFTGYTPSNPSLWCAGHDGETIGAVPFCGKGKAVVAALGGL